MVRKLFCLLKSAAGRAGANGSVGIGGGEGVDQGAGRAVRRNGRSVGRPGEGQADAAEHEQQGDGELAPPAVCAGPAPLGHRPRRGAVIKITLVLHVCPLF